MADVSPPVPFPGVVDVKGNKLTLLTTGEQRLEALIGLIDTAQRSLRLLYYIFEGDGSGRRVRDALLAACKRGVKVTLLVDGFGCEDVRPAFFNPLVESACRFCRFEPRWSRRYLLRNHQKLALADETTALIGGFNISDEYFDRAPDPWRDLGVLVEGPAVLPLIPFFDELFSWSTTPKAKLRDLRRMLESHSQREGPLRWLFGGPTRRLSPWAQSVKKDMMTARRVDLVAAYFAPSRGMLRRLFAVAERGRARVVTASRSDNGATVGAARHAYARLLRHDVRIYEYQPAKLHTKLIVIDDVVHIGSANFDMRSLYLNLEVMLRVEDAGFASAVRSYVDAEIADSRQITAELHQQESWITRVKWSLAHFVVATMDYNVSRRLNFGMDGR